MKYSFNVSLYTNLFFHIFSGMNFAGKHTMPFLSFGVLASTWLKPTMKMKLCSSLKLGLLLYQVRIVEPHSRWTKQMSVFQYCIMVTHLDAIITSLSDAVDGEASSVSHLDSYLDALIEIVVDIPLK